MLIVLNPIQCRPLLAANLASIILSFDWLTANILKYAKCADKMALFILFSYFFYWPDTKAKYLTLRRPLWPAALCNGTHQLQRRHSSKFIMALNVGCIIIFFSSSGLALWRVPAGVVVAGQLPGRGSFREDGPLVTQLCRGWDLRYAACLVTRG